MRGLCRSRESLKYEKYDSAPAKTTQLRLDALGAEVILARALSLQGLYIYLHVAVSAGCLWWSGKTLVDPVANI